MMRHAFALGYHRVVWRGNGIVKGRRCDTAWFSILAPDWPAQRARFEARQEDDNFDVDGAAIMPMPLRASENRIS